MGSDLPPPETSDGGHTPCATHSSWIPLTWGESECSGVHLQKLGPVLNGDWYLSMVFPLEERAHPENVIPRLKNRVPPPAAALSRPFQMETSAKFPEGSVAGNAPTATGTCGDGVRHSRQPRPTSVGRGFEGLVPGTHEVQELPAPIRGLFEQAVPLCLRQTIQRRLKKPLRCPGTRSPAHPE